MDSTFVFNTIRICIKANKYSYGDRLIDDIRFHSTYVVIVASDAGAASTKKIQDKCRYYKVPCFTLFSKQEFYQLFAKDLSAFGVNDANLAKKLLENLNKGGFYYEK